MVLRAQGVLLALLGVGAAWVGEESVLAELSQPKGQPMPPRPMPPGPEFSPHGGALHGA